MSNQYPSVLAVRRSHRGRVHQGRSQGLGNDLAFAPNQGQDDLPDDPVHGIPTIAEPSLNTNPKVKISGPPQNKDPPTVPTPTSPIVSVNIPPGKNTVPSKPSSQVPTPTQSTAPLAAAAAATSTPVPTTSTTGIKSKNSPPTELKSSSFQTLSHTVITVTSSASKANSSVAPSSAINTGALVGGIGGGIIAIAGISFAIVFIMRRWRRSRVEEKQSMFTPTEFRRSAVLLDDPPSIVHGLQSDNMTQRQNINTLPAPSAYGNTRNGSEFNPQPQYSFSPGQIIPSAYTNNKSVPVSHPFIRPQPVTSSAQQTPIHSASYTTQPTRQPTLARQQSIPNTAHINTSVQNVDIPRSAAYPYSHTQGANYDNISPTDVESKKRPDTMYSTVYNLDDAYGGID